MKSFFKRLFSRTITFNTGISNFVEVVNSLEEKTRREILFCGFIENINFDKRTMVVNDHGSKKRKEGVYTVLFDQVVTISRMKDGRLRMWIKVKED